MQRRTDVFFFFFNDTATTEIYTLSLHDALPICPLGVVSPLDPLAIAAAQIQAHALHREISRFRSAVGRGVVAPRKACAHAESRIERGVVIDLEFGRDGRSRARQHYASSRCSLRVHVMPPFDCLWWPIEKPRRNNSRSRATFAALHPSMKPRPPTGARVHKGRAKGRIAAPAAHCSASGPHDGAAHCRCARAQRLIRENSSSEQMLGSFAGLAWSLRLEAEKSDLRGDPMKRRSFVKAFALAASLASIGAATQAVAQQKTVKEGVLHCLSGTMGISETGGTDAAPMGFAESTAPAGVCGI